MAYFCLTVVEGESGRKMAARRCNIEFKILDNVGRLSTNKGHKRAARKARASYEPLSETEERWLEAAVLRMIAQAAEVEGGRDVELTMRDLPQL